MPQVEQVDPNAVAQVEQPQAEPQDVASLVSGIEDGLMTLREMLEKTPGVMPEDKKRLDGVLSEFHGLISENLSAAPGESMQQEAPARKQVSMEQGTANAVPAM